MRSSYKRIGDYIQLVDERNRNLSVTTLLGLTINKEFIPSVANTVDSDMANYKIIRKGQFACSLMQVRRDKKIPVAMLKDYEVATISQAYPVFEIADTENLLPEYLMVWMSRSEFDREACFYAVGGVRGSLEWDDFCNMELPVPSIEKQREIVKEYKTITDRIKLNEQLNQKLEETAQAIYKQWFVDFEFPISKEYALELGKPELEGKPYKSSGGEMVLEEEVGEEVPKGWKSGKFGCVSSLFSGYAFKGEMYSFNDGITVVRGENVTERNLRWDTHKRWNEPVPTRAKNCFLNEFDIIIGMDGSKVGKNWTIISKYQLPLLLAQRVACVRAKHPVWQSFLYYSLFDKSFENYVSQVHTGTSVPHISGDQIMDFPILIPDQNIVKYFYSLSIILINKKQLNDEQNIKFKSLLNLLLSKISIKTDRLLETIP